MKATKIHLKKLENLLIKTYQEKEKTAVSDQWQAQVMSDIRRLGPFEKGRKNGLPYFEQLVWRFAPVTFVLIVLLTTFLLNFDFASEYEIAAVFMDDPVEFSLVQSFWI